MQKPIDIDQALFGYREGHNLISSSVKLTASAKEFLATVTDNSGSENAKQFETSVTGLAVPESDFYALFRTWRAPEMPRPGCVWSHVLLIKLIDIAQIDNLASLKRLFRRPKNKADGKSYEMSLTLTERGQIFLESESVSRAEFLVEQLYNNAESSLVVFDSVGEPWVDPILSIWSQQWPRLRREFSFSSGSLGDRSLPGVEFDLQIAPSSSERFFGRRKTKTTLIHFRNRENESSLAPDWLVEAKRDLQGFGLGGLHTFLFKYGSDIAQPRKGFSALTSVYSALKQNPDWRALLKNVASAFPDQNDGLSLKRFLLSEKDEQLGNEKRIWDTTNFLLNSSLSEAFANVDFDFAQAARFLWRKKPSETIDLLSRFLTQNEKSRLKDFCCAVARTLNEGDFLGIANSNPDLVSVMIWSNPRLAMFPEVWRLSGQVQTQIYETLTRLEIDAPTWGQIMGAMFIAATFVSIRDAVHKAKEFAMPGAFRWLKEDLAREKLPSQPWREAIAPSAMSYLEQQRHIERDELALCLWCAPVDFVRENIRANREDLQILAEKLMQLPHPLIEPTAFMLLAIGLRNKSESGLILISECFDFVHSVLADKSFAPESWWILIPELPYLGIWKDWDRCEKLRRAVEEYLKSNMNNQLAKSNSVLMSKKIKSARVKTKADVEEREFID